MRLAAAVATLALALALAGCAGEAESDRMAGADLANGKALFVNGKEGRPACGSCHTLAAAGTQGQVGPNLDHAFGYSREQGFDESSFFDVTLDMIALAAPPMPRDLVTGQDAVDVAAYVAAVAGTELAGVETPQVAAPGETGGGGVAEGETDGKSIFTSAGCSGCHTLADAGSTGTIGPDLDDAAPSVEVAVETITNGRGAMPAFGDQLSEEQIQAVAEYVASAAGG